MSIKIQKQTVTETLWKTLGILMDLDCLKEFRLVGGTSLSLLLGHRISIGIDLFTDAEYRSIDFLKILEIIKGNFIIVQHEKWMNKSKGNMCFVGETEDDLIKLDIFYTEDFVFPIVNYKNIRLSSLEEIVAMKLDVIGREGRKKDFWDIHELFNHFTLSEMLEIYSKRYPYSFSHEELLDQLINFENADHDPDPVCLKNKYWQLIKIDFEDIVKEYR